MTSPVTSGSTPICLHLPAWDWVLSTDLSAFGLGLTSTPTLPLHLVNAPEFGGLPSYPHVDPTTLAEFEAKLNAMWEIQKGFAEHITKCIDGMGENFSKGFNVHSENLATVYNQATENAKAINSLAEHLRGLGPHLIAKGDVRNGFEHLYGNMSTALKHVEGQFQAVQAQLQAQTIQPSTLRRNIVEELSGTVESEFTKFLIPHLKSQLLKELRDEIAQGVCQNVRDDLHAALLQELTGTLTQGLKSSLAAHLTDLKQEMELKLQGK